MKKRSLTIGYETETTSIGEMENRAAEDNKIQLGKFTIQHMWKIYHDAIAAMLLQLLSATRRKESSRRKSSSPLDTKQLKKELNKSRVTKLCKS